MKRAAASAHGEMKRIAAWIREGALPVTFRSPRAELRVVASGNKPISAFAMLDRSRVSDLVRDARKLGLSIVTRAGRDVPGFKVTRVYAFLPTEAWRVDVLDALADMLDQRQWSNALEALNSKVLGYSDRSIRLWLAEVANRQAAWMATTLYLFCSEARYHWHGSGVDVHADYCGVLNFGARFAGVPPRGLRVLRLATSPLPHLPGGAVVKSTKVALWHVGRTIHVPQTCLRSGLEEWHQGQWHECQRGLSAGGTATPK